MPIPATHVPLPKLIGSWPIVPEVVSGTPTIIPLTVDQQATILGIVQESADGYNVFGKAFNIYIDGAAQETVTFTGSVPLDLATVIIQINEQTAGSSIAFADNGFLRLTSPNANAELSSLRLETATIPSDVFLELGLFSEIIAVGGQLTQAAHADPDRQVALPGQLALSEGESFDARIFNRALFQLGINTDRAHTLLDQKRIAVQREVSLLYPTTGSPDGFQFGPPNTPSDVLVYVGSDETPSIAQLERQFAVLDADGREFFKEMTDTLNSAVTMAWSTNTETGETEVDSTPSAIFTTGDPKADRYIISATVLPAALQNIPLKILAFVSTTKVVIDNTDINGNKITVTAANYVSDRMEIKKVKLEIDQVQISQADATRVEQVPTEKVAPTAPDRVELNNRIVVVGVDFVTADVVPGDLVTWVGHGVTNPFSNNGTYRVVRVVDKETIEVVNGDWTSVYLNPDITSAAPGTVKIETDGSFVKNPFLRFVADPNGAIPLSTDTVKVLYMEKSNIRDATDDPAVFNGGTLRYNQEADDSVQRAIIRLWGPNADTINDVLHGDERLNIQLLDERLTDEHYNWDDVGPDGSPGHQGRHKAIRPDTMNMFLNVAGITATIRGATGETAQSKFEMRDEFDALGFSIAADGSVIVTPTTGSGNVVGITVTGVGTAQGIFATGGLTNGIGVEGKGGGTNGVGLKGLGVGTGPGVRGSGGSGSNGIGGDFFGGSGTLGGPGVQGKGGFNASFGGPGIKGTGGLDHGVGGDFFGTGTGAGVQGWGADDPGASGTGADGALFTGGDSTSGSPSASFGGVGVTAVGGFSVTSSQDGVGGVAGVFTGGDGSNLGGKGIVVVAGSTTITGNVPGVTSGDFTGGDAGLGGGGNLAIGGDGVASLGGNSFGNSVAGVGGRFTGGVPDPGGLGTGGAGVVATGGESRGVGIAGATGGDFTGGDGAGTSNPDGGVGLTATGGLPNGTGTGGIGIVATGRGGIGGFNPGVGLAVFGGARATTAGDGADAATFDGGNAFSAGLGGRGITGMGGLGVGGSDGGIGVDFTGGNPNGTGGRFTGGSAGGIGVEGIGIGTGAGVTGLGATTGAGVQGTGGTTGAGVQGTGGTTGHGVIAAATVSAPVRSALHINPQDADPITPTAGDVYVHSVSGKTSVHDGVRYEFVNPVVIAFCDTSDTINGSTQVQQAFQLSSVDIDYLVRGNTLRIGTVIRSRSWGSYVFTGTPNIIFSLNSGGTSFITTDSIPITTFSKWDLDLRMVVTDIGANGVVCGGVLEFISDTVRQRVSLGGAIITNSDQAITHTVRWDGTSDAGDIVQMEGWILEIS